MSHWSFSRPELAEHYINILATGLFSNLAIIAPRRKGKTLFMLQDLAPLAKEHNYFPVYANLWQNINSPQEGLISAFQEALGPLMFDSPLE
jgi:predicted AAA+ superfamily ATPase